MFTRKAESSKSKFSAGRLLLEYEAREPLNVSSQNVI